MSKSKEYIEGEESFLENKNLSDNPYDKDEKPDEFLMWENGFKSKQDPVSRYQLQEDMNQ